ncbi:MAG TPA: hypothetical protein VNY73_06470 [Bacteroidia bacterium]|nr:hypothetical protein [Bacteroidia bacterium]
MKKYLFFAVSLWAVFVLTYCTKDIVATDITKKTVNILAPGNGVHTPNNAVTFWWDEIKGADKYQIQIVSPSFANVISVIVDSSVTATKLTLTLNPGTYEWRVRATNNSGSTAYSSRTFVIDTTTNLANVTIALLSPADSLYTNKTAQTFSWASVAAATQYNISILDNTGAVITSTTTAGTSFSYTFTQTANTNAKYTWKVRATNSFSNSNYTSRSLFIYLTTPSTPVAIHPLNTGTLVPAIVVGDSMSWSTISSGYYDSLFVFAFAVPQDTSTVSNPVPVFKQKMIKPSYKITGADTVNPTNWFTHGTQFYWRLNRNDKAGNSSPYSSYRIFKRN